LYHKSNLFKVAPFALNWWRCLTEIISNAQMSSKQVREFCKINDSGLSLLKTAMQKLNLSARAYDKILKVSRTIADLDNSAVIKTEHIAEAINYRNLDRDTWGS